MSKYKKSRESAKLDLTPLIDVVFLLIIFFMVTTTFNNFGSVQIDLPSSTIQQTDKTKSIEIIIDKDGNYHISEDGTLTLESPVKEIDTGSFLKGYAIYRAKEVLKAEGIDSAFITSISSMDLIGTKPEGKPWKIGLQNPEDPSQIIGIVDLKEKNLNIKNKNTPPSKLEISVLGIGERNKISH